MDHRTTEEPVGYLAAALAGVVALSGRVSVELWTGCAGEHQLSGSARFSTGISEFCGVCCPNRSASAGWGSDGGELLDIALADPLVELGDLGVKLPVGCPFFLDDLHRVHDGGVVAAAEERPDLLEGMAGVLAG